MSHSNFAFETSTNLQDYPQSIMHMEEYVDKIINHNAVNKLWFLEYPNLYTAGISQTKKLTVNNINNIPIYKSNRGGQITYHGPNMRICYLLYNLKNSKIGCDLKKYIFQLEECMINSLKRLNIESFRDQINHGVWVNHNNKIKKTATSPVAPSTPDPTTQSSPTSPSVSRSSRSGTSVIGYHYVGYEH